MKTNEYITIQSPLTNETIGRVVAMGQEEVDQVIKKAQKGFEVWKNTPLHERVAYLYKVADLLIENVEELTRLLVMEVGKDSKSAESEVLRTVDFIRFTADAAKNLHGQTVGAESFPGGSKGKFAIIKREPIGVVLAVSPFNYPVNLAASKIAPALIGGNAVVFKPATQGSLSGCLLAELFVKAGLPEGVLGIVTGKGSEIGDYVITHPAIQFINFTGSTKVGQHIAKQVKMMPLLMELGGKDAAIVLDDANLDLAAKHIVSGAFAYSGQRCTAIKRVLVLNEVADILVAKLIAEMNKLKVGNPAQIEGPIDVVPLINEKAADFVEGLIKDAQSKGGKCLCEDDRKGNLIQPTLIDNVTLDMRVAWEEPFGPILPIIRVNSVEEAIAIANKSEYGLQSSVFTSDVNKAFHIADKLEVGTVQINNKTERGPDHLPFLGIKNSGIGVQGISYAIEAMTRLKSTVINIETQ